MNGEQTALPNDMSFRTALIHIKYIYFLHATSAHCLLHQPIFHVSTNVDEAREKMSGFFILFFAIVSQKRPTLTNFFINPDSFHLVPFTLPPSTTHPPPHTLHLTLLLTGSFAHHEAFEEASVAVQQIHFKHGLLCLLCKTSLAPFPHLPKLKAALWICWLDCRLVLNFLVMFDLLQDLH